MIKVEGPYVPRVIRPLRLWSDRGWRMKRYGISCASDGPDDRLIATAHRLATGVLPMPPVTDSRYGVGFIGVHQGRGANLVFVDWWARENELHHHAWVSAGAEYDVLEYASPSGLLACVWDLAVIGFERQAGIDAVLAAPVPDPERYLGTVLEGRI